MCHGSRYMNEARKYRPKVAASAMRIIPEELDEKI